MVRILLAEDQALVRQGLKMMIETDQQLKVIAEASDGKEAVEQFQLHTIDLVILDIRMPNMTGLEATKEIKRLDSQAKILILTTFADDEYALEALRAGAVGYLLKDADKERLLASIHSALKGGMAIDDQVAAKVVPRLLKRKAEDKEKVDCFLSNRERSILILVGEGKSNSEIASELYLSVGTVKNHISHILTKLELRDRTQLAIYAIRHDYV